MPMLEMYVNPSQIGLRPKVSLLFENTKTLNRFQRFISTIQKYKYCLVQYKTAAALPPPVCYLQQLLVLRFSKNI